MSVQINPECRAGKHPNCDRDAFDDESGEVITFGCPCTCHAGPTDPYAEQRQWKQATPNDVEQRLYNLGVELDQATRDVQKAERDYLTAKSAYEIGSARAYVMAPSSATNQKAREAYALLECVDLRDALVAAEALVKASKSNVQRIYAHVDIARSVSVIVRAGIGAS